MILRLPPELQLYITLFLTAKDDISLERLVAALAETYDSQSMKAKIVVGVFDALKSSVVRAAVSYTFEVFLNSRNVRTVVVGVEE